MVAFWTWLACAVDSETTGATPTRPPAVAESCANQIDDDGDGLADCLDSDCDGRCLETCTDERDNDGDGAVDCADSDCNEPTCAEDCTDARDNDADGAADCSDSDCSIADCDELCADARDNDGDALVDCDDPDCDGSCDEVCDDGRDNDLSGAADCDDPSCTDVCAEDCVNGVDDDADFLVDCADDECDASCDADGDGWVALALGGDDCDDADSAVNPGAEEVCNGWDDNCDGLADEDDPALDISTQIWFYHDDDGDGFGVYPDPLAVWACTAPEGMSADATDCLDTDPAVNPAAIEACNGLDDDCDGLKDDADPSVDLSTAGDWFPDLDGDGWGAGVGVPSCAPPVGHVDNDEDCDDADPSIGAPTDFWFDDDGDGFGEGALLGVVDCSSPIPGWVAVSLGLDCDDVDPGVFPGAPETCEDGLDQDCDGADDTCCVAPTPDCVAHVNGDGCYTFCSPSLNWEDAQAACAADGAFLVSIGDPVEETWVDATIDVAGAGFGIIGSSWWMGFNDRTLEGTWVWDDGSLVAITHWYPGEPNDSGGEDCGTLNRFHPDLGWNDDACHTTKPYVCER